MVIKSGRLAPCTFFSGVEKNCIRGHTLDCLQCPDYTPFEQAGEMGIGVCAFEAGHVYHLVRSIESDGFYRSAATFCHMDVDEGSMAVEIYQDGDIHAESLKGYYRLCKRCAAILAKSILASNYPQG